MRDPDPPASPPPFALPPHDTHPTDDLPGRGIPVARIGVATEDEIPSAVPPGAAEIIRRGFVAYRVAHPDTPAGALVADVSVDCHGGVVVHPPESIYGADAQPAMGRPPQGGAAVVIPPAAAREAARNAAAGAAATTNHPTPPPQPPTPPRGPAVAPQRPRSVGAAPLSAATWTALTDDPTRGRRIPVIGFAGPRGSGKDAAAIGCFNGPGDGTVKALPRGWVTLALADDLKRRVAFAFGVPWPNLTGPSHTREVPVPVHADWQDRWGVVFGPALFAPAWLPVGEAPPPVDRAFCAALDASRADVWDRIVAELASTEGPGGTPKARGTISARYLLQWIGTDFARRVRDGVWIDRLWAVYAELCRGASYRRTAGVVDVGPAYWPVGAYGNSAPTDLPASATYIPAPHDGHALGVVCGAASYPTAGVIVTDARFPNEVRAFSMDGPPWVQPGTWQHGAVWWIEADGAPWCPPRMNHASEPEFADLAPYVSGTIVNRPEDGDLAAFTRRVLGRVHGFLDTLP